MFSPLIETVVNYGLPIALGIVTAFLLRGYFVHSLQNKIRGYQSDIVKSHAKILELEAANDKLQKQLHEMPASFSRDKILMN